MKIVRFLFVILAVTLAWGVYVYAKETPDELKGLYAQAAVLMDADSGRILFGKNEDTVLPMASTTKIMTCILALENMETDQIVTASENAVKQPKVHLGVNQGDEFYIKDLLYSLMLESHNDSAVMIAEGIAGSEQLFAKMMNDKAEELGCTDTYFITPNGLDAEDEYGVHSTTAKDLARILRYCIMESEKKEEFIAITGTKKYQFMNREQTTTFACRNHNAFLEMMEGAFTGKTGFTNDAGYCYVSALEQDGKTFIVSLLACGWPNNKSYKWTDTRKLMEYGLKNFEYDNLYRGWKNRTVSVVNGAEKQTVLVGVSVKEPKLNVLIGESDEIDINVVLPECVNAPVVKNQMVGKIEYLLNEEVIKLYPIVSLENISERNLEWCLRIIANNYFM